MNIEKLIERFYIETGKSLTVEADSDALHYSIDYVNWLENELINKLTTSDVIKSFCVQTGVECGFPCHSNCPLHEKLKLR